MLRTTDLEVEKLFERILIRGNRLKKKHGALVKILSFKNSRGKNSMNLKMQ